MTLPNISAADEYTARKKTQANAVSWAPRRQANNKVGYGEVYFRDTRATSAQTVSDSVCGIVEQRTPPSGRADYHCARQPVASAFSHRGHYTESKGIGVQTIIV